MCKKETKWFKKCPGCKKTIFYSHKNGLRISIQKDTKCMSCSRKPRKLLKKKTIKNIITLHKKGVSLQKISNKNKVNIKTVIRLLKRENEYIDRSKTAFFRKYHCNNNYFNNVDNERKAYWLGLLAADGNVSEKRDVFSLTLHDQDREILDIFLDDLQSNYHFYYYKNDNCVNLVINSKKIKTELSKYNIVPRKTFSYRFPLLLNKNLYSHFIRGYFDGDGCIYISKSKQIEYSITSNEYILKDIQQILMKECNINKTKLKNYKKTIIKGLVYCGNQQAKRIYNYLYKNATIYFPRKKEKAESILFP